MFGLRNKNNNFQIHTLNTDFSNGMFYMYTSRLLKLCIYMGIYWFNSKIISLIDSPLKYQK